MVEKPISPDPHRDPHRSRDLHIALASLDPFWEDRERNLPLCRDLARAAAARGARLLAFPELTLTGFTMQATSFAESPDDSPTIRAFAELAREAGIAIAFGVVLHGRERPRNHLVVVNRTGAVQASYAKVHPFSFAGEAAHYEGGGTTVSTRVADVAFGLSVCYDLRFPELYRALAAASDALLVIANWPGARIEHWHALLRARAIENQAYVVAVNRTGRDGNGLDHPRSSAVIDPAGSALSAEWSEGVLEGYRIDAARVQAARAAFPVLADRRPGLYAEWLYPARPAGGGGQRAP